MVTQSVESAIPSGKVDTYWERVCIHKFPCALNSPAAFLLERSCHESWDTFNALCSSSDVSQLARDEHIIGSEHKNHFLFGMKSGLFSPTPLMQGSGYADTDLQTEERRLTSSSFCSRKVWKCEWQESSTPLGRACT